MQVLEIHSQLEEKDHDRNEPLKDKEVAVLKEMCNVSLETQCKLDIQTRAEAENQLICLVSRTFSSGINTCYSCFPKV